MNQELLEGTRNEMDKWVGPTEIWAYYVWRRGMACGI